MNSTMRMRMTQSTAVMITEIAKSLNFFRIFLLRLRFILALTFSRRSSRSLSSI
jgi:hypothetical protein